MSSECWLGKLQRDGRACPILMERELRAGRVRHVSQLLRLWAVITSERTHRPRLPHVLADFKYLPGGIVLGPEGMASTDCPSGVVDMKTQHGDSPIANHVSSSDQLEQERMYCAVRASRESHRTAMSVETMFPGPSPRPQDGTAQVRKLPPPVLFSTTRWTGQDALPLQQQDRAKSPRVGANAMPRTCSRLRGASPLRWGSEASERGGGISHQGTRALDWWMD
nr:uncharacterized protein LOC107034490 [Vicugna pacos]